MPDAYFITDHALEQWLEAMKQNDKFKIEAPQDAVKKKQPWNGGGCSRRQKGNTAAATSTGGAEGNETGGLVIRLLLAAVVMQIIIPALFPLQAMVKSSCNM